MILVLSYYNLYVLLFLLAEVAVGFATSFGGSLIQQKIDNGRVSWRKALENGVNGAISSAIPNPLNKIKSGDYALDFHWLDQTFRRGKVYFLLAFILDDP